MPLCNSATAAGVRRSQHKNAGLIAALDTRPIDLDLSRSQVVR